MSEFVKKLYAWCLNKVRFVAGSIRAFLPRVLPSRKKSVAFLKRVFFLSAMLMLACPVIMRVGGGAVKTGPPTYTYSGSASLVDDGDDDWRLIFISSGTLIITSGTITVDIFCVGGGGSASTGQNGYPGSGAGGYTKTYTSVVLQANTSYSVVIGAGGAAVSTIGTVGHAGGITWFGSSSSYYANGGGGGRIIQTSSGQTGGNGGSGGAGFTGSGGTDGGNGNPTSGHIGGYGQGTTTREFGEATGTLYATGGTTTSSANASANTGNGSGMAYDSGNYGFGYAAGSGICIIRNHRAA